MKGEWGFRRQNWEKGPPKSEGILLAKSRDALWGILMEKPAGPFSL